MTAPRDRDPAPVYGLPDLHCPISYRTVRRLISNAVAHPWRGGILSRRHTVDTDAILTPGRPTRVALTWDADDACLHMSVSHPRLRPGRGPAAPEGVELPSAGEVDAWTRVIFADRNHLTQLEVTTVAHVRLCFDHTGRVRVTAGTEAGPPPPAGPPYPS